MHKFRTLYLLCVLGQAAGLRVHTPATSHASDSSSCRSGVEPVTWIDRASCSDCHEFMDRSWLAKRSMLPVCLTSEGRQHPFTHYNRTGFRKCLDDQLWLSANGSHVMFIGDSILRGVFRDLFLEDPETKPDTIEIEHTSNDKMAYIQRTSLTSGAKNHVFEFVFLGGLFDPSEVNDMKPSTGQSNTFANPLDRVQKIIKISSYDIIVLGSAAWDLMFVHNLDHYAYQLERVVRYLRESAPHSRIIFRTGTPLGNPSPVWQGSNNSRGTTFNHDILEYNAKAVEILNQVGGIEILDAHSVVDKYPHVVWNQPPNSLHFYCEPEILCFDGSGNGDPSIAIADRFKSMMCKGSE